MVMQTPDWNMSHFKSNSKSRSGRGNAWTSLAGFSNTARRVENRMTLSSMRA